MTKLYEKYGNFIVDVVIKYSNIEYFILSFKAIAGDPLGHPLAPAGDPLGHHLTPAGDTSPQLLTHLLLMARTAPAGSS